VVSQSWPDAQLNSHVDMIPPMNEAQQTSPDGQALGLVHCTCTEMPPSGHDAMQLPVKLPGPPWMQHVWPLGQGVVTQAGTIGPPSPKPPLLLPDPLPLPLPPPLLLPLPPLLPPSSPLPLVLVEPPHAMARPTALANHKPRPYRTLFIGKPSGEAAGGPYRSG
jgi:hypothetical protein